MTLVNVFLFSLGVLAIAAPLWVHLRLGRVKKRAVVSTLRLMRATPQSSKSPRRFVDIPLLLLRSLILLLLALGFGRWLIPGLRGDHTREYAVFVLDVSGSMQAQNGGARVWDEARERSLEALGKLDLSSRVALVLSPAGLDRPTWISPAEAIRRVKALDAGYGTNRLGISLREGTRLLAEMPDDFPKVIHVVSDFQRSALAGIDGTTIPAGVTLELTKAGPERLSNRGVAVTVASAGITDLGTYSFTDLAEGTLRLEENGAARTLTIAPGQEAVRISHAGKKGTWITRKMESNETDAIAADNTAWDVFQAQEPIPFWLWEPEGEVVVAPSQDASMPEQRSSRSRSKLQPAVASPHAYDQASYYIRRALQPATEEDAEAASRYRPVLLTEGNLGTAIDQPVTAESPGLLVLPGRKKLAGPLPALAKRLIDHGGAVVFFAGSGLDPATFNAGFGQVAGVTLGAAEPCKLAPALEVITESNPLLGSLDGQSRHQLAKVALTTRFPIELKQGAIALVSYADGVPFIVEQRVGKGRAYFVNTSADREWGDWAASAQLFVPALHLLCARAVGEDSASATRGPVMAGEPVTLQLPVAFAGKSLKAGGGTYPVDAEGRVPGVIFEKPGVNELVMDNGAKVGWVAANFPPGESLLETYPEPVVRQRLESLRQNTGGSSVRWESEELGGLAWRICLGLAALLMMIEPIIANRRATV